MRQACQLSESMEGEGQTEEMHEVRTCRLITNQSALVASDDSRQIPTLRSWLPRLSGVNFEYLRSSLSCPQRDGLLSNQVLWAPKERGRV